MGSFFRTLSPDNLDHQPSGRRMLAYSCPLLMVTLFRSPSCNIPNNHRRNPGALFSPIIFRAPNTKIVITIPTGPRIRSPASDSSEALKAKNRNIQNQGPNTIKHALLHQIATIFSLFRQHADTNPYVDFDNTRHPLLAFHESQAVYSHSSY